MTRTPSRPRDPNRLVKLVTKHIEQTTELAEQVAELRKQVGDLIIWRMAAKDIISRLISYTAMNSPREDETLRHFSESGDYIADKLMTQSGEDFSDIAERMRQEKDWLISNARSLLREED